jgi:UDP-4-amino-4,6-dideoxy-N-acetyl-beta-L-altrosamine transaminase
MTSTRIPYGRQDISQADIDAVVAVLRSDYLTQGPILPKFEAAAAKVSSARYAIAVNSATSALHIACMALDVGPGDIVWTSPITFVASANCALYCGATVDFVDIDPRTYNLSVERLTEKLAFAEKTGALPKVVIPVHLGGQSCDMTAIHALSVKYGFKIIEDASHAVGGRYKDKAIGSCRFSDISIFSFHPVKIITSGEGGMALTNDHVLSRRMQRLRSHGITRDAAEMTKVPDGLWYYEQIELGFNYRMTELQGALGLSQLIRLDEFVSARHARATLYDALFSGTSVVTPWRHPDCYSAWHLYVVRAPRAKKNLNKRELFQSVWSKGIDVNLHYIPIYRHPFYAKMGFATKDFPEAENYYSEAITLPMYPALQEAQQVKVVQELLELVDS